MLRCSSTGSGCMIAQCYLRARTSVNMNVHAFMRVRASVLRACLCLRRRQCLYARLCECMYGACTRFNLRARVPCFVCLLQVGGLRFGDFNSIVNRAVSFFLASASHDARQPLRPHRQAPHAWIVASSAAAIMESKTRSTPHTGESDDK